MRWLHDRRPRRRAPDDALRRPGRRQRSVLRGRARRHHRADRPERRRQDHRVQLHHRLLQADRRHDDAAPAGRLAVPARAHARLRHQLAGEGRPHLPEHPPVLRHDGAREPAGRPAQPADDRLRLHRPRRARHRRLSRAPSRGDRAGEVLAREDRPHRPRRRSGRRPALWRPAPPRDRPRHVHRPGAALPRRAGRRPQPARVASSSTRCCARSATSTAPRSC